jgi:probable F420-dependent oxidoreductase
MTPAIQLSTTIVSHLATPPPDWSHLAEVARAADQAGFDRLVLPDHVVFGENLDEYADPTVGGTPGRAFASGPDALWLEPLTTIAYLSALTERVRFASGILLAALRRPVVLAKVGATIDVLSGGRLDLGVGVGWQRAEYEAAGLDFDERGRLLDHTIEVCQALWRSDAASYDSEELSFDRLHQMPKPVQPNGVPVWVSGTVNKGSMQRLARYGSGWIPWGRDALDVEQGVIGMRAFVERFGRDPSELGVVGTLRSQRDPDPGVREVMAAAPRLRDAGVTDFRIALEVPRGASAATEYLSEVVAAFRAALA